MRRIWKGILSVVTMLVLVGSCRCVIAQCPDINVSISQGDTTVCVNSSIILNSIVETEFADGDYRVSWEKSIDGNTYYPIVGAENTIILSTTITTQYYFRCVVVPDNDECESVSSSRIHVGVYGELHNGGQISCALTNWDTSICYNTIPNEILNISLPESDDNDYVFKWQKSTVSASAGFSDIQGAHMQTFRPDTLVQSTYYRRLAISSCDTVFSNVVYVQVYSPVVSATILPQDTTICYMTQSEMRINVPASGGNGVFSNHWQLLGDDGWHDIETAVWNTYTTVPLGSQTLSDSVYYYSLSSETGCGIVSSDSIRVSVYGDLVVTNHAIDTLCYMTSGSISVSAIGEGGEYTYQWWESYDGVSFSAIQDSDSSSFTTGPHIGGSMYYRCVVTPTNGCEEQEGDLIEVVTYQEVLPGTISGNDTICYNTAPISLNILTECTGGGDLYSYMWQSSEFEDGEYTDLSSVIPYQSDTLQNTTYYRLRYVSNKGCDTVYSDTVMVLVYQPLVQATILPLDTTICYMMQSELRINESATGGNGEFANRWQIKENGLWHDVESATGFSYTTDSLGSQSLSDTVYYYRLSSESLYGCGTVYSDSVKVNVYGDLVVMNHTTDTLCYMTSGSIWVSAVGEGGAYSYQWQQSEDGVSFANVQNSNSASLTTEPHVGGSFYYRCVVTPTNGCEEQKGDSIEVVTYQELLPGTISGNDTVCYNAVPVAFSELTGCTGGGDRYSYMWQSSETENGIYSDLSSTMLYQSDSLTTTTYYRLRYISEVCNDSVYSDTVMVLVYPQLERATILPLDTTICYMTQSEMRITESATGGNGDFANRWQIKENGLWHDIESATGLSYTTDSLGSQSLSDTVYYYMLSSESLYGCGTVYSDSIRVHVYGDLVVTNHTTDTLCSMTSGSISVSATGEGGEYAYQWQESADGVSFTDVQDAVSQSFTTEPQAGGSMYYWCMVVPTNGCEGGTGAPIEVVTYSELLPGTISGNDTVCYNAVPVAFSELTGCTGGGDRYSYMWQSSETENGIYSDLSSTMPYQSDSLTTTTYYRLRYVSEVCNDSVYSDTVMVLVYPQLERATILPLDTTICYMTQSEMRINEPATGGNGDFYNHW